MTIEEMKKRKKELGYTNADLAELSKVPKSTITKIFSGATRAPRRETILALQSVLCSSTGHNSENCSIAGSSAFVFRDNSAQYNYGSSPTKKRPGEYTLDDYLALPDDQRVELIDGVFYDMAAPHALHQFIAIQIGYQLMSHIEKNHGPCRPVLSPIDVQLDCDNKTVVQPDVVILCNPASRLKNGRIFGAPDFVIEILSPSTKRRDLTLKLAKYSNAGVKELWYVDPKNMLVISYDLAGDCTPRIHAFNESIPVHIWNDEFAVDFKAVYEYVKDYL